MKQTKKMSKNMLAYELERVLPQLTAIGYTTRSVMGNILENASKGDVDAGVINAEIYTLLQHQLINDEILESLYDAITMMKKSDDN